ncbi:hypothetical protein [Thioalkalivibrio sp. HK1]|uniref:hypothetical protein n=1 Tax=Thioalkalivibrio sp. HK1 TaxID=1469245 RepID=UPI00046E94E6|nr:hypothetical protein [Thioalkalivibrio sp. HK1]
MQTKPDDSLEREHAPPGSAVYYATLFAGRGPFAHRYRREASIALHALRERWLDIIADTGEPHIKDHKINWWSDEIMEARDGHPRHPVSIALSRHAGREFWRKPEVIGMLRAAGDAVAHGLSQKRDVEDFCRDFGGNCLALKYGLVNAPQSASSPSEDPSPPLDACTKDASKVAALAACGRALERAMLANPPPSLWAGLQGLFKASPADLEERANTASHEEGDDTAKTHRQRIRGAGDALSEALALISPAKDSLFLETEILLRIRQAEIRLASNLDKPRPTSITPLRKLFIAWRCARKAKAHKQHRS